MTSLLQCVFVFLLGLALTLFGLVHSYTSFPGHTAFSQLAAAFPAMGSVLLFVLCLFASVAGIFVLVWSSRRLRYQWRFLRQVTARRQPRPYHASGHFNGEMEDEQEYAGAYR